MPPKVLFVGRGLQSIPINKFSILETRSQLQQLFLNS